MSEMSETKTYQAPDRARVDHLLLAIGRGDQEALGDLYELTRGAVYGAALGLLCNCDDAQEITQDTFVRIWETAASYRSQGSPMAWILTICRNLSLSHLRRVSRTGELSEEQWLALPAEDRITSAEDRAVLQDALSSLKSEDREILLLHAMSGLKHREIAALLQIPLPTVLSRYHRTIKKLKAQLEGV